MNSSLGQLLLRWVVLALGVMLATKLVPGIAFHGSATTLFWVVLLLSFFNALLKPLLVLFTLPFIIVTLGLGVVVINALLFLLVGNLVPELEVRGFWAAVGGSLVVSVTNWLASSFIRSARQPRRGPPPPAPPAAPRKEKRGDDVIDI